MRSIGLVLLCIFSLSGMLQSQNNQTKLIALNNYVQFANESIHGLLIVHRLLENFNQDINKYVDLESNQINFYSNKDLPENIFVDPDKLFYSTSPSQWYDIAINGARHLPYKDGKKLNTTIRKMVDITRNVNQLRFDLETQIASYDLTDTTNLNRVYTLLENGVDYYDSFYELHLQLRKQINLLHKELGLADSKMNSRIKQMRELHQTISSLLHAIRTKDEVQIIPRIEAFEKAYQDYKKVPIKASNSRAGFTQKTILKKASSALESAKKFNDYADVPTEYKQYGKYYYYHNSEIVNYVNQYGIGFVSEMNKLIDIQKLNTLKFQETPHYFKVIYPEKLKEDDELIVSSDDKVDLIPEKLKEREITTSSRVIKVDSDKVEFRLYDHLIQDGDIVSINFNGDWILEKHSLEAKPTKLKLQLNKEGKNYLLLHAENIGKRPPNTMAISYKYLGKEERILLKSDLNTSELIEIELTDNGIELDR